MVDLAVLRALRMTPKPKHHNTAKATPYQNSALRLAS